MARRARRGIWGRSLQRVLKTMTRTAVRMGTKTLKSGARRAPPAAARAKVVKPKQSSATWAAGLAVGIAGARRYRLYQPPGVQGAERLPLLVMLHGCGQDAEALAAVAEEPQLDTGCHPRAVFSLRYRPWGAPLLENMREG